MSHHFLLWWTMDFPQRLATLRKQRSLTQQALADRIGVHLSQLKRYEGGTSQPTLEVLRQLAIALSVSADVLLFDQDERGPDEDFKLRFEALTKLDPDERSVIKELIDGMLLKHEARRLAARPEIANTAAVSRKTITARKVAAKVTKKKNKTKDSDDS